MNFIKIFESIKNNLIFESKATGHMSQLFDDPDLTFNELKNIFIELFKGQIEIVEKLDGQKLMLTYKNGQFGIAIDKQTLQKPIDTDNINKIFNGKSEFKEAFQQSINNLVSAIKTLNQKELNSIFANGQNFIEVEIIYPPIKNIIDYGNKCLIVLHQINVYNEKYVNIGQDELELKRLFNILKRNHALKQDTFEISGPIKLKLKNSKSGEESLKFVLDKLSALIDGLGWNATINDYAQERFEKYIINKSIIADFPLTKNSNFVQELAARLSNVSKRRPTKNELSVFAKREGIDVKSDKYKDFINELDSDLDNANQIIIKPLEDLVIGTGLLLMKNLEGFVAADPKQTSKRLAAELDQAITELSSEETSLDIQKLSKFKKCLKKLDSWQREVMPTEGIIFLHKNKPYKLISTFGEITQILGILKK